MRTKEKDALMEYFYRMELRLEDAVDIWDLRSQRRRLDAVDHLEEILAKEQLKAFRGIRDDIILLLKIEFDNE